MKKIIIIGSKGMAGHLIRQTLIEANLFEVIDISKSNEYFKSTYTLDLKELSMLDTILKKEDADIIINCAGILNELAENNPENSIFVNSFLPHFLAARSKRLLHISTDCVFDGSRGNYTENDIKDGLGFYAETKSLGEVLYAPHLTIRTSIIGPELKANGIGLLHWFLKQNGKVNGYTEAFWSGVTTLQLAKGILHLIDSPEITGLIHYTNNEKISKYELLKIISVIFQKDITIEPSSSYHVDKSLRNTKPDLNLGVPGYIKMITELYEYVEKHKYEFYQQYYR